MDTVARFGGDEFVVIVSHLDLDKKESLIHAGHVAEKIRVNLARPYVLSVPQNDGAVATVEHHCTVSIGVTLFLGQEQSEEEILKQADKVMYEAKEVGRNAIRFFEVQDSH
jgi:diguanylate cyclase (GGDEF)-like protein